MSNLVMGRSFLGFAAGALGLVVFSVACDSKESSTGATSPTTASSSAAGGGEDGVGGEGGSGTTTSAGAGGDGGSEAPAPALAIECLSATADVYITPAGLPPLTPDERGAIVRCALAPSATIREVQTRLAEVEGVTVSSGYTSARIAYRTERDPGVAGAGTARLYLPDTPAVGPSPVVVVTHGTAGLADQCALSPADVNTATDDLVLPWVAAGLVVIAPDYAGLGNEGVQGYGNTVDTGHSVLDAARAALEAVTPGALDGRVIVAGHSQGGGAALAAQALGGSYGAPDLTIAAIVGFASGYARNNAAEAARFPFAPINGGQGVQRAVVALAIYADFANMFGQGSARDGLHPAVRDHIGGAIDESCIFDLVLTLATPAAGYTPPDTLGQMIDPTFRTDVVTCLDGGACTAVAQAFIDRATANVVPLDGNGGPVLMLVGQNDLQQTPASQACLKEQLELDGLAPQACVAEAETHFTLVGATVGFAVEWARAVADGAPAPVCFPGPALPVCD